MEVPDLGPVTPGGKSVLDHDLTHYTSGIPHYPAFDDAFKAGLDVIAPEKLTVTGQSSSSPGDAFYAQGQSLIKYWFGHLVSAPPNGKVFSKGAKLGDVLNHNVGGGPHVHVGIDARPLTGQELIAHSNYTHGAPTVGEQLTKMLGEEEDGVYDWLDEWLEWQIQGQHREPPMKRPAAAPDNIPDDAWDVQQTVVKMLKRAGADGCYQKWRDWYEQGKDPAKRPDCAPETIYEEWWEARERDTKIIQAAGW